MTSSSYPSWFAHIGIDKSNNYSTQFFSGVKNTKITSILDETASFSTTDQGNTQDTELEKNELADDPDPELYKIQSNWNELCFIQCDKCNFIYFPQAFMQHNEIRHLQQQDSSLYQHRLYKKKTKPTPAQEYEKKRKLKNGKKSATARQNKRHMRTDLENNASEANIDDLDVKSGPGYEKKRRTTSGPKRKKQKTVPIIHEKSEENSWQTVTEKFVEEPENTLEANCQLNGAQNCMVYNPTDVETLASPVHGYSMPLDDVSKHCENFPSENTVINQSVNSWFSAYSWLVLGLPLPNNCSSIPQNTILDNLDNNDCT
ncbi:hypothetical protein AVEN_256462-1, partial [Araneus ventricosus]